MSCQKNDFKEIYNHSINNLLEMNNILFEYFSTNKAITILYIKKGIVNYYSGIISKIDVLNKIITFLPRKKINMENIYSIVIK